MDLFFALCVLKVDAATPGSALYRQAWAFLYAHLHNIAARKLHGSLSEMRDQAVESVEEKIRRASPLDVIVGNDPERRGNRELMNRLCEAYLRRMVVNDALNLLRRSSRYTLIDPLEPSVFDHLQAASASIEADLGKLRAVLESLFDSALARTRASARRALETAWSQLLELCFGHGSMATILVRDEGINPSSSPIEIRRARDRVLQNHSRLRKRLTDVLEAFARAKTWCSFEIAIAEEALQILFRKPSTSV
ncbi:MAG: hypothetical protein U0165_13655 [Polyangiaceae bacterium]